MTDPSHPVEQASTTAAGLPVSPSMGPTLERSNIHTEHVLVDRRVVLISFLSILLALASACIAQLLLWLIALITNISFHHTVSAAFNPPVMRGMHSPWFVIIVPVIGGIIVGFMARYGSEGIRGHGIPEAMEKVLLQQSRIPPRLTFLKPLSAAVAIGTGGPFGAEGPIIATGGALGSVIGQFVRTTAAERKTLLAAGAAAGMAATFGSPVSATLLAIELLLFEFRPRSFLPVALAASAAAGLRYAFGMTPPLFPMPDDLKAPTELGLALYAVVGLLVGIASVYVTHAVYAVEDLFDLLPIHWMWWPAIGAVAVGVVGYFAPRTLGVGYDNITDLISLKPGSFTMGAIVFLCVFKFISWAIALGSGTSGGTLAPLFTIGSAIGALIGIGLAHLFPNQIDPRIAALVGMAAMFAGASRALLTSVVFAFETTLATKGLLPLLGGCAVAYFASSVLMRHTIMTAKIVRRGVRVPAEYAADYLDTVEVADVYTKDAVTLPGDWTLQRVREWIASDGAGTHHQGYPIVDERGELLGILTRRNLLNLKDQTDRTLRDLVQRPPLTVFPDNTLRDAADVMVRHDVGRLAVVTREAPRTLVGVLTRGDVLSSHRQRLDEMQLAEPALRMRVPAFGGLERAESNGDEG